MGTVVVSREQVSALSTSSAFAVEVLDSSRTTAEQLRTSAMSAMMSAIKASIFVPFNDQTLPE
jgi:hypothetical protein